MASHSYWHSKSCGKCSQTFLIFSFIHNLFKPKRSEAWLIFVSTPFILILHIEFMCGRTGNQGHPVRIIFGVLFAATLYGESASYVWQFNNRVFNLYYLPIDHRNSSVDYAVFNLMNSGCRLVPRQLSVACGMHLKRWKAKEGAANEATVLCITNWFLKGSTNRTVHVHVYVWVWGASSTPTVRLAV